jgi:hypothetical protein
VVCVQGLNMRHAYGLVAAREVDLGKGKKVRLVRVRNPWGKGEWKGAWSDTTQERDTYVLVSQRKWGRGLRLIKVCVYNMGLRVT